MPRALISVWDKEGVDELARGLAIGAPPSTLVDAARRLTRIGHSSGWDMLAGLLAALVPPASSS